MFRGLAALLFVMVLLSGCNRDLQSKDRVQDAILERLRTKSGLDLASLNVTTTAVKFEKNMAYATVAFHPKDNPSVTGGTIMKYTLEDRGGKWVVTNVADSQGRGLGAHAGTAPLPPGHPQVPSGEAPDGKTQ